MDRSINLVAQRAGALEFGHAGSLWLAVVRVHSGALLPTQIAANFNAEQARFMAR